MLVGSLGGRVYVQILDAIHYNSGHDYDYYEHDLSHVLRNKSNYSQSIIIIKIRGVMSSIKDLNINSSTK